ncbi:MAG: hypothetical protein H6Q31_2077 [Bacteroidetes bacterium]|nr:hypothetical protein [Bacteroidota bacterium]
MHVLCAALENSLTLEHQSGERCSLHTPVPASRGTCVSHSAAERSFRMSRPVFNGIHGKCAPIRGSDLYLVSAEVPEQGIMAGVRNRIHPQVPCGLDIFGDVIDV